MQLKWLLNLALAPETMVAEMTYVYDISSDSGLSITIYTQVYTHTFHKGFMRLILIWTERRRVLSTSYSITCNVRPMTGV